MGKRVFFEGKREACACTEQRGVGKTVNFATIYGQSAYGLAKQLKIEVGEAQAYIIKRAMITIHRDLPSVSADARMLLQVHDELLFEVPEKDADAVASFVKKEMESAAELSVPLVVDIGQGPTWADAH